MTNVFTTERGYRLTDSFHFLFVSEGFIFLSSLFLIEMLGLIFSYPGLILAEIKIVQGWPEISVLLIIYIKLLLTVTQSQTEWTSLHNRIAKQMNHSWLSEAA